MFSAIFLAWIGYSFYVTGAVYILLSFISFISIKLIETERYYQSTGLHQYNKYILKYTITFEDSYTGDVTQW